jgi:excisionase family DNA binding protein
MEMNTAYQDDLILTTAEAANLAKLHKTTVFLAIKRGDLKAFNVCPGARKKYRIMRSDLIQWLTSCPVNPQEAM